MRYDVILAYIFDKILHKSHDKLNTLGRRHQTGELGPKTDWTSGPSLWILTTNYTV